MALSPEIIHRYLRPSIASQDSAEKGGWTDIQNAWLPSKEHGFVRVKVLERFDDGRCIVEMSDKTTLEVKGDSLSGCNNCRFDRCEDVAEMAELSEATVLHNLKLRYDSNLIYTYSGLFLVAINPYKQFPIYSDPAVDFYRNQVRFERPPHIYAVADEAYRRMISTRNNQSILITGESGAGKTENTKRVIQYLATVAGNLSQSDNLEQKIIQANVILESFGNAQTVRNNNSSRFGKFVKIDFNNSGIICGANIEMYLLEKSRVTHRNQLERSFHVFYQFLSGASKELKDQFGIDSGPLDYSYLKHSNVLVEGVDDSSEFLKMLEAMKILRFTAEEQATFFRIIAAILHLGNLEFEEDQNGQAILRNFNIAEKVCLCLGINPKEFVTGLLNPVIKAGRDEIVSQSRDMSQVIYSVEALSRSLYDRMFSKLIDHININIDQQKASQHNFIGVLDIAGFEIFAKNSFEQLCINHTNEKLQQFFNHNMFIMEQEEYKKEGLEWNYIDFGLDLQPTIDLIERSNPIGILANLDEDCVLPKATDKSFCEKVSSYWKGKSGKFEADKFGDGFRIHHYAGKVNYSTDGWLVKNKDPLNENVTRLLSRSVVSFISNLFKDYAGNDEEVYQANKGTKKGLFRTVAQRHKESLTLLMQELYSTQPHFVRCIIPNEVKKSGLIDAQLVLDQLRCNGVLEGIRICRLGYPNRLPFAEFCRLYEILGVEQLSTNCKEACQQLLKQFGLEENSHFKIGHNKVFFKNGEIAKLDEMRDQKLSLVLRSFQSLCRYYLAKRQKTLKERQQVSIKVLQRNIRQHLCLRQWSWWRLFLQVKPLLNVTRSENRIQELETELERVSLEKDQQLIQLRGDLEKERNILFEVETKRRDLERENQSLSLQLAEANESRSALMERKMMMDLEFTHLKEKLSNEMESQKEQLQQRLASQEKEKLELNKLVEEQKELITSLKYKLDEVEFEKLKLEKSESNARQRLSEMELLLEETRRGRKDLELKLRQVEDSKRQLQEQLEDETQDLIKRRQLEEEFALKIKQLKQEHDNELIEKEEEWEQNRKRLQRELHELSFDFEQEKKQTLLLKETVKKYESGTDSLASQLEAEMRNQTGWKREKERLEQRVKEMIRQNNESLDREESLNSEVGVLHEQVKELRSNIGDLEEKMVTYERQRKSLESKNESLNDQNREIMALKQSLEKSINSLETQVMELNNRFNEEQDANLILNEKLRSGEQHIKLTQIELENERKQNEMLQQEKSVLEMQIKELQLKLLDFETSSQGISSRSSRQVPSIYQQILSQIESDSIERQQVLQSTRRLERQVRDLQTQLYDRDRQRISLEESLEKNELKLRKLQTTVETLENRNGELEVGKKRLERDLIEERNKIERLNKECERFRIRLNNPSRLSNDNLIIS